MLDFLIKGGTVIDGTGKKPYKGDVGIAGDRIMDVGALNEVKAKQIIDAKGMAISPGFIDIHSHHDLYIVDQDPLFRFESFIRQGVTSSVVGNCGWTLAPCLPGKQSMVMELIQSMGVPMENLYWNTMDEYLSYIEKQDLLCNVVQLIGHGTIRLSVMGNENRFCTPEELNQMKNLLREGMEAGCAGFSTGLMYYPGMYAHTNELISLAKVAGEYGRPYATHLRGYCSTLNYSLEEAIAIAESASMPLQISHMHAIPFLGRLANILYDTVHLIEAVNSVIPLPPFPNPDLKKGLEIIQAARDRGVDIGMDAIPYTLGNTTATTLLPPWASQGGKSKLLERLGNDEARKRMEKDIQTIVPKWPHWEKGSWSDPYIKALGWKPIKVLSVKSDQNRWTQGKSFLEIGNEWGVSPFEALCRLILEEEGNVTYTFGYPAKPWTEKMLNNMIRHPLLSIGADSIMPETESGTPPPSAFGCFPRILGHYCRKLGLFPIEEAVWKMTGLPAARYGLEDRGKLEKNAFADIVIFNPDTINEKFSDNGRPAFAEGISSVFINGAPILSGGELTGDLYPGRVLRK